MSICPVCAKSFDERGYQLVIPGLGSFDSVACAEEGVRRQNRRARDDLLSTLLDAVQEEGLGPKPTDATVERGALRTDPPD